jgi:16S rRNA (uracil1498-N3)-methyltransferase
VNLFYQPLIPEGILYLDQEESRHCVKVLRKNTGDIIRVTDGKGSFYDARIEKADQQKCSFVIEKTIPEELKSHFIHIAISPTKNADPIEWFVEKAVEFGVDEITPVNCQHTERSFIKKDRLEKVAISAMKQSLKASLPRINSLTDFADVISSTKEDGKFIAYVDDENPDHLKDLARPFLRCLVLIGPEGDFSPEELSQALQSGFRKVSLGKSRLRTETAGMAAVHILNLVNN